MQTSAKRAGEAIIRLLPPKLVSAARLEKDLETRIVFAWKGVDLSLKPVWVGQGYPRDLERTIHGVDERLLPEVVFVAREFSRGSRATLADRELNWADEAGNAWIALSSGLLISSQAARTPSARNLSDRWSAAVATVSETMLTIHLRLYGQAAGSEYPMPPVGELAELGNLSAGRVSEILRRFDKAGYTKKTGPRRGPGSRRHVADPTRMLSDWAAWHSNATSQTTGMHTLWSSPYEFVERGLTGSISREQWAVTGWLAADILAPLITEVPTISVYLDCDVYDSELDALAERLDLRRVESGHRVLFIRAERQVLALSTTVSGIRIVSPIRLYGDLLRQQGRGEDAAEHLRRTIIGW